MRRGPSRAFGHEEGHVGRPYAAGTTVLGGTGPEALLYSAFASAGLLPVVLRDDIARSRRQVDLNPSREPTALGPTSLEHCSTSTYFWCTDAFEIRAGHRVSRQISTIASALQRLIRVVSNVRTVPPQSAADLAVISRTSCIPSNDNINLGGAHTPLRYCALAANNNDDLTIWND